MPNDLLGELWIMPSTSNMEKDLKTKHEYEVTKLIFTWVPGFFIIIIYSPLLGVLLYYEILWSSSQTLLYIIKVFEYSLDFVHQLFIEIYYE